jgi:hypothetical protein
MGCTTTTTATALIPSSSTPTVGRGRQQHAQQPAINLNIVGVRRRCAVGAVGVVGRAVRA